MSAAKAWVGPHATELVQDCVQLHGGIGVTWEHDLHLYLRRTTVNRATYGTPEEHARARRHPRCWERRRDATPSWSRSRSSGRAPGPGSPTTCRRSWACRAATTRSAGRRDHERALQRRLWDGGFAGICFPAEYGGLGLTIEHQRAFTEESLPYDMPFSLNVPDARASSPPPSSTSAPTSRSSATSRRSCKGEELWVQFLSEPSGGSDLAGVLTRADRDGDVFILNGSKIWSSGAAESDYAMCLARTNWDVPKHRGLTMFIMKIHQPGIQVEQIRQVDGSLEFCQEFFDDVPIPAADVIGEVDDGWTVATRLLVHERNAVGGGSPYLSGRSGSHEAGGGDDRLVELVQATGRTGDAARPPAGRRGARPPARRPATSSRRVTQGVTHRADGAAGQLAAEALQRHRRQMRRVEIGLELAGVGRGGVARGRRRTRPRRSASSASGARACRSAAAATRSSATSSASACSACPASSPPTATCPTAT